MITATIGDSCPSFDELCDTLWHEGRARHFGQTTAHNTKLATTKRIEWIKANGIDKELEQLKATNAQHYKMKARKCYLAEHERILLGAVAGKRRLSQKETERYLKSRYNQHFRKRGAEYAVEYKRIHRELLEKVRELYSEADTVDSIENPYETLAHRQAQQQATHIVEAKEVRE